MKPFSTLVALIFIGLLSLAGSLSARATLNHGSVVQVDTRLPQATARLILRSPQTAFPVNQAASLNLIIDTAGARIDQADIVLSYSPARLRIDKIVANDSTCSGPLSQNISPTTGIITLSCALARSSVLPQLAPMATLTVTPITAGTSLIKSTPETELTGAGREVLRTPALFTLTTN